MSYFKKSLAAWKTEQFEDCFKQEVCTLKVDDLPLQQALKQGSHASVEGISVMITRSEETMDTILVNAGIFFNSFLAGCHCSDDPSTQDSYAEFGEFSFRIDKKNAKLAVKLIN